MSPVQGFKLFDGMFTGLEGVLDLRSVQHRLTAGNLANADTPGYKAKELPFRELLGDVMDGSLKGERPDVNDMASSELREIEPLTWSLDGNSVSAETEAMKLAENQLMYNAVSGGISKRLAMLRFAASDGKG